jgi:hypothetical protein
MKTAQDRRGELWVLMQLRRLGFGRRNPLRRRVDRIESTVVLFAVLAGLVAVPAGAAFGTWVREQSEQHAAQQRSVLQPVQARTAEDAPVGMPDVPGEGASKSRVVWQVSDGSLREGRAEVPLGTKANTELTIWLDRSGAIAAAPRPAGDSAALGGGAGLAAVMGSWFLLWLLVLAARLPLERRRMREWQADWERVAPLWNRRQT